MYLFKTVFHIETLKTRLPANSHSLPKCQLIFVCFVSLKNCLNVCF